jgi:hypothetical protein
MMLLECRSRFTILDQAPGIDTLRPALVRRNFAADPEWLP